jgi:small subunit ribosomal protein S5e
MSDVVEEVGEEVAEAVEEVAEEAEEIAQEEDEFVAAGASQVKLFAKWSFDDIEIRDMSLEVRYWHMS